MIKIPTYQQRTQANGFIQGHGEAPRMTDPVADAVGEFGRAAGSVYQAEIASQVADNHLLKRQQEEDGKAYAGKAISDAHVQWQTDLQQRQEKADPGAPGFTPAVLKDFDEYSQKAIEQAPTDASKRFLTAHLNSYRTQLSSQALGFEARARVAYRTGSYTDSVDNWATQVARDPSKFNLAHAALGETIPDVDPIERAKLEEYRRKNLIQGAAAGSIMSDPESAYNQLIRATLPASAMSRDKTGTVKLPAGMLPDWVQKIADEEGADPRLVAAIYAQESGSGKNARTSIDGAQGGFQVMPSTFKAVMKGQGDPNNEQDNARAGIRLISQLQGKYGVDPTLVGAAYFSGEGNVTPQGIVNPNRADGNGKTVKSYAADIGRKFASLNTGTMVDAGTSPVQFGEGNEERKVGVPWIDAMNITERQHYLQQAEQEVRRRQQIAQSSLELKVRDQNSQALTGQPVKNPATVGEFVQAYGTAEGLRRYGEYQDNQQFGRNVQQVAVMTPAEQAGLLERNRPIPNSPGYADDQKRFELLSGAVDQANKDRAKDPLTFAQQHKLSTLNTINFQDPNSISSELKNRSVLAGQNMQRWGVDYQVLTKPESEKLGEYLSSLQPQDRARVLGQIYDSAGQAGMLSISEQLKDKHDSLAIAAALASRGTTAGRNVASLYLEGKDAIAQKRAKIDSHDETGTKANIFKSLDGVYLTPQARDAAADAAYAIYAKFKSEGSDDWERAVRLSTGGLMDYNGSKIAKPYGWEDSRFRDTINTVGANQVRTAENVFVANGKEVAPDELAKSLPGAKLQSYGDGSYLIKSGSDFVRLPNGRPFVLKVGQ